MSLDIEEVLLHRDDDEDKTKTMKFVVVGDSNVGKTSLCKRVHSDKFSNFYTQTIDNNFQQTKFKVSETCVNVQHLDIAGFQRYSGLTQQYYQGAVGALIVFDMTNEKSLEGTHFWKSDIDAKCCTATQEKIPCLLVGTKLDLKDKQEFFKTEEEFENYAKENGYIGFQAISSLDGSNVKLSYEKLISYVLHNNFEPYNAPIEPLDDDDDPSTIKRFCCC